MDSKQEINALAEKIDNFASKINKKKEKKNNNSKLQGKILIKLIILMIKEITLIVRIYL